MKPRLKLHLNQTVSLATAPESYRFYCEKPRRSRHFVVANLRDAFGSVSSLHRRFGLPHTIVQIALSDGYNKEFAMGGASGALRTMLGLPVCSSANTKPLDAELRVPLAVVVAAWGKRTMGGQAKGVAE